MTGQNERVYDAPDVIRVLRGDGTVATEHDPGLTADELRTLYRLMTLSRALDRRLTELEREGRVGFHGPTEGHEATAVGAAFALRATDWLFPTQRELGAAMARGVPVQRYVDNVYGNAGDVAKGRQMPDHVSFRAQRIASVGSPTGGHVPQAVGFAWAAKSRGEDLLTAAFFGEAAISGGDVHNGLNFAGVFKAPTLFLCRNASWSAPTAVERQTATESFAERAIAYGVTAWRVDGDDALAVIGAVREAAAKIRAGEGPVLLELLTAQGAGADDPLARLRRHLEQAALWDAAQQAALDGENARLIGDAITQAERASQPALDSLFDDVYATPPWHLAEQRERAVRGPRPPRAR